MHVYNMLNNSTILSHFKAISAITTIGLILTINLISPIQSQIIKENNDQNITIDPVLTLNKNHLPLLQRAERHCTNETIKNIITKTIETLQQKEIITAEDMKKIITDLSIDSIWISFLKPIYGSPDQHFFCFPGLFILNLLIELLSETYLPIPYIGPSIILTGTGSITIFRIRPNINANTYALIGFLGRILYKSHPHGSTIDFAGVGLLTIAID